jgi:hypothetical protein
MEIIQKHKVLKWRKASKATQRTLEDFWGGLRGVSHGDDSVLIQ